MKFDIRDVEFVPFKGSGPGGQHQETETWKPYPENPSYWASDLGRLMSTLRGKVKILKPQQNGDGYAQHTLSRRGKLRTIKLQKIIMETFVGPRPDGLESCHKDGDRMNCRLDNLYYGTHSQNIQDIYRHGTENPPSGSKNGMARITEDMAREIKRLGREGWTAPMIEEAFPVSRRHASDIIAGRAWRHLDEVRPEGCRVSAV